MKNEGLVRRLANRPSAWQSAARRLENVRSRAIILVLVMLVTVLGLDHGTALLMGDATITSSGMIAVISPLHVEGGKILDVNSNEVWLRGINFETWIYDFDDGTENANGQFVRVGHMWTWNADKGTSWDTSTAEGVATELAVRDHMTAIKSWGLNCVRFHFSILPWINDASRMPADQYRYHLKRTAEIANDVGIYVIYDAAEYKQHSYPWAFYPFYPYDANAPSTFNEDAFANWWGEVSAYLGDLPNVIFEIYNEPHHDQAYRSSAKLTEWQRVHNKAIAAIRQHSQNLVLAQYYYGLDGYQSPPYGVGWIYDYPLTGGNVVYSAHAYRYHNHFGNSKPYDRATLTTLLTQMKIIGPESPINTNTAPMIIGETGAYFPDSDPNEATFLTNFLDILNSESVHYIGFEWGWPGRGFSMLQNEPMIAPASTSGEILRDAMVGE